MITNSLPLTWLLIAILSFQSGLSLPTQPPQEPRFEFRDDDPLGYALRYARKSNNQFAVSEIAVRYAELGDFEQALRVNESAGDEDWRTEAFGSIALEYWKHGEKEKARQLFIRVAGLPLPKDVSYVWGDIIRNMAKAQQFDLALDTVIGMVIAEESTAGSALDGVIDEYVKAKTLNSALPDLLPRMMEITRGLPESGGQSQRLKRIAVAYAALGQYDRATKLIQRFEDEYDREDSAHELAIQFGKLGLYGRAVSLAERAGEYFGEIALVKIASEALKRGDKSKALEIAIRTDSRIAKKMKAADYELFFTDAVRMSELAVVYSKLGRKDRAVELMNLAFKIAKSVGKPGERQRAFENVVHAYCELGLYDEAIDATKALANHDGISYGTLAEVGARAQRQGQLEVVAKIIKMIESSPPKENKASRLRALVDIARAGAERGRYQEAQKLLLKTMSVVETLEASDSNAQVLKDLVVAFAEAGNLRAAVRHIPHIGDPFYTTKALIDIGTLCAKKGCTLDELERSVLEEVVKAELPAEIQPGKLINEAGWEIPGLAQARMLRPPELQRTRDRSIELYYTYYAPEVEILMPRPFPSRRQPKPEEAEWMSEGLKVRLIQEVAINGHKFCYRVSVEEAFHDKATGTPRYVNHLEALLYYDEDGDGKFETLEEGLGYFGRGHIPKWVLEK